MNLDYEGLSRSYYLYLLHAEGNAVWFVTIIEPLVYWIILADKSNWWLVVNDKSKTSEKYVSLNDINLWGVGKWYICMR